MWKVLESTSNTIKNADGDVEKLVIINRDITERKAADEQLEQNSFQDQIRFAESALVLGSTAPIIRTGQANS